MSILLPTGHAESKKLPLTGSAGGFFCRRFQGETLRGGLVDCRRTVYINIINRRIGKKRVKVAETAQKLCTAHMLKLLLIFILQFTEMRKALLCDVYAVSR